MAEEWHKVWIGGLLVIAVITVGSIGFHVIGQSNGLEWGWWDCIYMTVITVSTVGYGEILPIEDIHGARIFTVFLILFGMGMLLYFASAIVSLVVEINIQEAFAKQKRDKAVQNLKDHIIVCGAGTTGIHVIKELEETCNDFIVVENDEKRIEAVESHLDKHFLHIIGDATDDDVLLEAGIKRAAGVVTCLSSDKDNLFVTITARQLNTELRIVSRCRQESSTNKMERAGADAIVSPNMIGGLRMVSEMIRPEVVQFLDVMLRKSDAVVRVEEATVPEGSSVAGKRLADTKIRTLTKMLVIAVRAPNRKGYEFNPGPDFVLQEGSTLVLLGETTDAIKIRDYLNNV